MATSRLMSAASSVRSLAAVLALGCAVALAVGMLVQHGLGHPPCSLCVLQRLAFVTLLALGIALAVLPPAWSVHRPLALLAVLAALAGLGVAVYQVWIGFFPSEIARCGRGPAAYFEDTPLEALANWTLDAAGDCGKPVRLFDLVTMPQLGLLGFVAATAVSFRLAALAYRRKRLED